MEKIKPDLPVTPIEFIRNHFLEKKKTNSHYTIAAYARYLCVSPSFLSRLLAGERPLTVKLVVQIGAIFELPNHLIDDWTAQVIASSHKNAKISHRLRERFHAKQHFDDQNPIHFYELERFKAISQWYHLAILNLTFVKSFKSQPSWIARRLGITKLEAMDAIQRLVGLGLLEKKADRLCLTNNMLFVNQKKNDPSVRQFHQQMCEKAKTALEESSAEVFDEQYFSGLSLAFDRKRMPEFKEKLQAFSQEMLRSTVGHDYSDVYHLNIQLFPVTHSIAVERKKL